MTPMMESQHGTRNAKKRAVISSEGDMLVQHVGIVTQVGLGYAGWKAGDLKSNVEVEVEQRSDRVRERVCEHIMFLFTDLMM